MGTRFSFLIDVDPALQRHPFPPLLLISLVENAIKHGIERSTGAGQISLDAAIVSQGGAPQLSVNVIDTGVGLRTTAAMGTGLANIRDQLTARFGPQGSLTLQDRAAGGGHRHHPRALRGARMSRPRALVAEDELPQRRRLCELLGGAVAGAGNHRRMRRRPRRPGSPDRTAPRGRLPRHPHAGSDRSRGRARRGGHPGGVHDGLRKPRARCL